MNQNDVVESDTRRTRTCWRVLSAQSSACHRHVRGKQGWPLAAMVARDEFRRAAIESRSVRRELVSGAGFVCAV